jgi:hypothetical protein
MNSVLIIEIFNTDYEYYSLNLRLRGVIWQTFNGVSEEATAKRPDDLKCYAVQHPIQQ